tara:strand:+ start:267 stop:413 length:147 start_codon:yes stop_codon:yes gene_type:complete
VEVLVIWQQVKIESVSGANSRENLQKSVVAVIGISALSATKMNLKYTD